MDLFGGDISSIPPIFECHDECECHIDDDDDDDNGSRPCANRLVQLGVRYRLDEFECEDERKGRGVRTRDPIRRGAFVAEYLGEVIGQEQADEYLAQRQRLGEPNYIMHLREHFCHPTLAISAAGGGLRGSNAARSTIIDARNYSGIARTINHSCEPNLFVLPVRIKSMVPHAALFALRDIRAGEELSYDYNPSSSSSSTLLVNCGEKSDCAHEMVTCLCASSSCRGFLPNAAF